MKKCVYLLIIILMLPVLPLNVSAMGTESAVQLVHISQGNQYARQIVNTYAALEDALRSAESGDVIEIIADLTVSSPLMIPDGMELTIVSGTRREHTVIVGESGFVDTDRDAVTRVIGKGFDGSLFILGEGSRVTLDNIIIDGNGRSGTQGGLFRVGTGAVLTAGTRVTMRNSRLGADSRGGAVWVAEGGRFNADAVGFENNAAAVGNDVYTEGGEEDTLPEETEPEETETEKPVPDETEPEETEPEETETEKPVPDETEPEETGSEETEAEETAPEETEAEETEAEETQAEETQAEETAPEWTEAEETEAEKTGADEGQGCGSVVGGRGVLLVAAVLCAAAVAGRRTEAAGNDTPSRRAFSGVCEK